MQILFLMADGFEETEFVTPFDYLQRAGIDVALASVSGKAEVVDAALESRRILPFRVPIRLLLTAFFCPAAALASRT